ncbi:MAG TPA: carbohydrate ABC transporter permease [Clostridia bacterium]|nr:carbohydrate ABC transporter permease [Clostridia bacterium]
MKRSLLYTRGDRIFLLLDGATLLLIGLVIAYPLWFVVVSSFNGGHANVLIALPERWSLEGYRAVFEYRRVWTGYYNSLRYMVLGTSINLAVTICAAYPLSKRDLFGGSALMLLFVFTMYFGGGLIPFYLLIRGLGLLDTIWSVLLPGAMSVYNMIVMRTYFSTQIPDELREASELDGCGALRFLLRIVLPLSAPILAVIGLFYAVGHWNAYFNAMIFISNRALLPLQVFLREILVLNQLDTSGMDPEELLRLQERADLMRYSLIVVASLPVLALYPLVQRYFVKGMMIGALKG